MNGAHLHLILNHFPVVSLVLATFFLFITWFLKNEKSKQYAYGFLIAASLLTMPAFMTGEMAEEVIENLPQISEPLVESHEEFAEKTVWVIGFAGLFAAIALFISLTQKKSPKWIFNLLLLFCIAASGMIAWTANLGGQINHPEIRDDFKFQLLNQNNNNNNNTSKTKKNESE